MDQDDDMRPRFALGEVDRILQKWTPEQIALAGVSRTAIAAAACFANRHSGGYDAGGPEDESAAMLIRHIQDRVADNPDYDQWANG